MLAWLATLSTSRLLATIRDQPMQQETIRTFLIACVALLAVALTRSLAEAEAPPCNLYEGASCKEVARAGWPRCWWVWAERQDPCDYTGYYVGGGAPGPRSRNHARCEGTWGWDYQGKHLARCVRLDWTCPVRHQGGTGSYQPDGPRVIEELHEKHANHQE